MSKKPNAPQPVVLKPVDPNMLPREPITIPPEFFEPKPKPLFPVLPVDARSLADQSHADLPPLLESTAAAIRAAAAKGAYSTSINAKSPLLETLSDRLARAGYVTRQLAGGVLIQWS